MDTRNQPMGDEGAAANNPCGLIWKAEVMPKIKVFAWKLLSNAISIKGDLARRGMQIHTGCPICNVNETVEHLIWGCGWVHRVWYALLGLNDARDGCLNMKELLQKRQQDRIRTHLM